MGNMTMTASVPGLRPPRCGQNLDDCPNPKPWQLAILFFSLMLLLVIGGGGAIFFHPVCMEGESCHKSCFRCSHGGCSLTSSTYAALDSILYCKPHFSQLFKQRGSYNHLTKSTSSKKFMALPLVDQQQVEIAATANKEAKEGTLPLPLRNYDL